MRFSLTAALVAAFLSVAGGAALAQPVCATYERATRSLTNDYGEAPLMRWLANGGRDRFELWGSRENGTVSILRIPAAKPDVACLVAVGEYAEAMDPGVLGDGA